MQSAYWQGDPRTPGPGYDQCFCVWRVYRPMSGCKGHCVIRSGFVSPTLPCFAYFNQSILFNNPWFMPILARFPYFEDYLQSSRTGVRPRSSEAEPRARRAQAERLLDWGPWGIGHWHHTQYIRDTCYFERRKSIHKYTQSYYFKRDVNVPHGKAATETLMLTTVVSLASDDPGLGAARDTETSRGGGEGVTMLRPESDAEWRPGRRQSRSMSVSRSDSALLGTRERDVCYNMA